MGAKKMIRWEKVILFPDCAMRFTDEDWAWVYRNSKNYETCLDVANGEWKEATEFDDEGFDLEMMKAREDFDGRADEFEGMAKEFWGEKTEVPTCLSNLSEEDFDREMMKAQEDFDNGRVYSLEEVEKDFTKA